MGLPPDFKDLLAAFAKHDVSYLLVGGYAVAVHGRPRYTKDIDLWLDAASPNLERAAAALTEFGAPATVVNALGPALADEIVYLGTPPVRVDLFKSIPGLVFSDAYGRRVVANLDGTTVAVVSRDDLITAKRTTGRPQDLEDVKLLERMAGKR